MYSSYIHQQTHTKRNMSKKREIPHKMSTFFVCLAQTSFHSSGKDGVSGRTSNSYLPAWDRDLLIMSQLCFCRISWKNSLCVPWKINLLFFFGESSSFKPLIFFYDCFSLQQSNEHTYAGRKEPKDQISTLYSEYSRTVQNSSQYVLDHGNKSPGFT